MQKKRWGDQFNTFLFFKKALYKVKAGGLDLDIQYKQTF